MLATILLLFPLAVCIQLLTLLAPRVLSLVSMNIVWISDTAHSSRPRSARRTPLLWQAAQQIASATATRVPVLLAVWLLENVLRLGSLG